MVNKDADYTRPPSDIESGLSDSGRRAAAFSVHQDVLAVLQGFKVQINCAVDDMERVLPLEDGVTWLQEGELYALSWRGKDGEGVRLMIGGGEKIQLPVISFMTFSAANNPADLPFVYTLSGVRSCELVALGDKEALLFQGYDGRGNNRVVALYAQGFAVFKRLPS